MSEDAKRKFAWLDVHKIHRSTLLPPRYHNQDVYRSVEKNGLQQFIIVRPHPTKAGEYEIIDGHGRWEALKPGQKVPVDIREGLSDKDVFAIAEQTFKRTPRSTYEQAAFVSKLVDAISREEAGSPMHDAATILGISDSQVSQYIAIHRVCTKLESVAEEDEDFNALKRLGINRLYQLTRLETRSSLLEVARQIEGKKGQLSLPEIKQLVDDQISTDEFSMAPNKKRERDKNLPISPEIKERCQRSARAVENLLQELNDHLAPLIAEIRHKKLGSKDIALALSKAKTNLKKVRSLVESLSLRISAEDKFAENSEESLGAT